MDRTLLTLMRGLFLSGCAAAVLAAPASGDASRPLPATSPEEALRNYRRGQFERSEEQYSALARERPDDARLRFNAGAAAYRRNDLTNAARWFESVVSAPDLELQQQAYYNLGNTRYRLGEAAADPQGKQRLWQEALTNFTAASKLDAADAQAAGNLAFVRQKLTELQQQPPPPPQQQQQQQQQSDNKDQDPQQDSSQSQQRDNSSPSSENSPGKQPSPEDPSGNPQGEDAKPKDDPGEAKGEERGQDGSGKPEENQAAGEGGGKSEGRPGDGKDPAATGAGEEAGSAGDQAPGEMTRAQALQVLEGQKGDEKALLLRSYGGNKPSDRAARVRKPW